jgi:hypothetical protein
MYFPSGENSVTQFWAFVAGNWWVFSPDVTFHNSAVSACRCKMDTVGTEAHVGNVGLIRQRSDWGICALQVVDVSA